MSMLQVTNLVKKFGTNYAVNGIEFAIEAGRCVALLGPNGAGKTTTLKMLTGLLEPTNGQIQFQGMKNGDDLRQYIGYLPQHPAFYQWMSGLEFLVYAGKLAHLPHKEATTRAEELLEMVGIAENKKRKIGGYSGGMKQRLGLAQALIHRPKLLVLDEPVSALDPVGRRDVLELMRKLKQEMTILFSTHVLHDAESISDDVLIIHSGEIVTSGALQEVRAEHQQPVLLIQAEQVDQFNAWLDEWSTHELITEVVREQDTVKIVVSDLSVAKDAILKDLVQKNISIRKFEVAQTTLEDLFMKVVRDV